MIDRRKSIGGSDCAKALGESNWGTPYELYLEKIGETPLKDDNIRFKIGRLIEPLILEKYEEETGQKVTRVEDEEKYQKTLIHPEKPFLTAHLDGYLEDSKMIFEAKSVRDFNMTKDGVKVWGNDETDMPTDYLFQCLHYCMIANALGIETKGAILAAMTLDGGEFRIYRYNRHVKLENFVLKKLTEFWKNVENLTPPNITIKDNLALIYKENTDEQITATSDIQNMHGRLTVLKERIKDMEKEKDDIISYIQFFMKEKSAVIDSDGRALFTWKAQERKALDQKALKESAIDLSAFYKTTKSRVFLVK